MTLAAVRGVIDFRRARLFDAQWWRHCRVMLTALKHERTLEVQQASFAYHRSLVANGALSDESFSRLQTRAIKDFYNLYGALEPWLGVNADNIEQIQRDRLKQDYIATFGHDPSDPKFQAEEAKKLDEWKQARELAFTAANEPLERSERQYLAAILKHSKRLEELQRRSRRMRGR